MDKTKKTVSDKEQEYLKLIEDTKKKLKALQNKKKIELGELAHKCGLGDFELKDLKDLKDLKVNGTKLSGISV